MILSLFVVITILLLLLLLVCSEDFSEDVFVMWLFLIT